MGRRLGESRPGFDLQGGAKGVRRKAADVAEVEVGWAGLGLQGGAAAGCGGCDGGRRSYAGGRWRWVG